MNPRPSSSGRSKQDKVKEIEFFDRHASVDEYNIFFPESNERLVAACLKATGLRPPAKVADLGCGSGVFAAILAGKSFRVTGVDISPGMIEMARKMYPGKRHKLRFLVGDVEDLDFPDASLDGVLLSGLLHHLPDPDACIREVRRVLKPGGAFAAFDPNRMNPFMYLYRDRSSPLYSSKGVTDNERPILAWRMAERFRSAGFEVSTEYFSDLQYRYIASKPMRRLLPLYNLIDSTLFSLPFLRPMRAFVILTGRKSSGPR